MKTTMMKKTVFILALFLLIPLIWSFANYISVPGVSTDHWKWYVKWSPDGKWITYAEQDSTGTYQVWVVPSEGGNAINLTKNYEGNSHRFPSFTSDSKEVTFSCQGSDFPKIVNINIDTGIARVIMTNALFGCWSHNGRYLVFRKADTSDLALYDSQTQNVSILSAGDNLFGISCFTNDDAYVITTLLTANGKERLYRIPVTGGEPQQLTNQFGKQYYPECSPDGSTILYTNFDDVGYWGQRLFVYNMSAQKSVQLFPDLEDINWCGSFSPDGKKLCYLLFDGPPYWYYSKLVTADMPQMDISQPKITVLSPNGGETWSADKAQTITWVSEGVNNVIIGYSLNGGTNWRRIATYVKASQGSFVFMPPDTLSTTCLFQVQDQDNLGIFDNSNAAFTISPIPPSFGAQLTYQGGNFYTNWSPDGKWIAYIHSWNDIFVVSSTGGQPINITEFTDDTCGFPCFSPDSKEVCFSQSVYYYPNNSFTKSVIARINLETRNYTVIHDNAVHVAWSHDGRYVVYREMNTADLYIFDTVENKSLFLADASKELELFNYNAYSISCFTPDDSSIITTMYDGTKLSLFKIPIMGGKPIQLTFNAGLHWYPDCSPDGEWIFYTKYTDNYGYASIFVYNTITKETFPVFPDSPLFSRSASFSPDGTKFCYTLKTNKGENLYIADFPFKSRSNAVNERTSPQSYSLNQNSPNPFNPTTIIEYTVPDGKPGHVRLKIYDSRGAFVRSLVDGVTGPGNYSAIWDGTDTGGKRVASGVYMYRLQAGEFVQSRKMLLLR